MKKNSIKVVCNQYAPEATKVYYNGHRMPGSYSKLWHNIHAKRGNAADMIRAVRADMKKNSRHYTGDNKHYAILRFADSGNVYAAGSFETYSQLKDIMHRTGRTLTIKFM